jgi:hypothetical protein
VGAFNDIASGFESDIIGPDYTTNPYPETYSPGISGLGEFAIDPSAAPQDLVGTLHVYYDEYAADPITGRRRVPYRSGSHECGRGGYRFAHARAFDGLDDARSRSVDRRGEAAPDPELTPALPRLRLAAPAESAARANSCPRFRSETSTVAGGKARPSSCHSARLDRCPLLQLFVQLRQHDPVAQFGPRIPVLRLSQNKKRNICEATSVVGSGLRPGFRPGPASTDCQSYFAPILFTAQRLRRIWTPVSEKCALSGGSGQTPGTSGIRIPPDIRL